MYITQNFNPKNMNKLKPIIALLVLTFFSFGVFAQTNSKDVSITSSGSGKTLEDAKQAALRSSTEQAFGAFISSKTEMFNDQVVADQMASVSSGNIKSYEVLNESQLPDGSWGVTLKAVVSVDKLTSFVAAKGIAIEIKGGMFALNIEQQLLNEEGEFKVISEMVGLLHEPMQISFDYVIKSSEPKSLDAENKNWGIPLVVTATTNKNMDFCANYCIKTLAALSLSSEEVTSYESLNKAVFSVVINYNGVAKYFYLRKQSSLIVLNTLTSQWGYYLRLFTVQSGMDGINVNADGRGHVFSDSKNYNKEKTINFLTTGQKAATFSWTDKRTLAQIKQMTGYKVKPRGVVSQFKHGGFVVKMPLEGTYKIGVRIDSVNIVDKLVPLGAASEAGIQIGDKIISLNGDSYRNIEQIREATKTGNIVIIKLQRQNKTKEIKVKPKYIEPTKGLVVAICDIAGNDYWRTGYAKLNLSDAKKACDELNINGYSDWYLPSVNEMTAICKKIHLLGLGDFKTQGGGSSFAGYCTSTVPEPGSFCAGETLTFIFERCKETATMGGDHYVRAVRAF